MPTLKAIPTPHTTPQSGFGSASALARKYEVSQSTIWRWAKSGRIPLPLKLGPGTTRWDVAAVQAALEGGE